MNPRIILLIAFCTLVVCAVPAASQDRCGAAVHHSHTHRAARASQYPDDRTEDRAIAAVRRLKKIRSFERMLAQQTHGKVRAAFTVWNDPPRHWYVVQVAEDHPDRLVTLYWFRVQKRTFRVLNPAGDDY